MGTVPHTTQNENNCLLEIDIHDAVLPSTWRHIAEDSYPHTHRRESNANMSDDFIIILLYVRKVLQHMVRGARNFSTQNEFYETRYDRNVTENNMLIPSYRQY